MEQILQFFDAHPDALPLYEKFEKCVMDLVPEVRIARHRFLSITDICSVIYPLPESERKMTARTVISQSLSDWTIGQFLRGSTLPQNRIRTAGRIMF